MHRLMLMFAAAFLMLLTTSCDPDRVYEQNIDFKEGNWAIDNAPVFTFEIQDTAQAYNIYFNVRHNLQYEFYNLYLQHQLTGPDSVQLSAALHEVVLMDAKTGKPLGQGSSDIYDLQVLALNNVKFKKAGTYSLKLTQYMRRDPLPHIMAAGIKVAKVTAR